IILVTDAGYQGIVALSACSTLPVSASTTSSASADAMRGVTTARAAPTKIHFNDGLRSSGRRKCTFPFRSFETRLRKRGPIINVRVSSVRSRNVTCTCAVALRQAANLYRLAVPEQRLGD